MRTGGGGVGGVEAALRRPGGAPSMDSIGHICCKVLYSLPEKCPIGCGVVMCEGGLNAEV